jgi:hypothetical protein
VDKKKTEVMAEGTQIFRDYISREKHERDHPLMGDSDGMSFGLRLCWPSK